jgi:hypothetical protein
VVCPGGHGLGESVRKHSYFASFCGIAALLVVALVPSPILAADLFPDQRPRSSPEASSSLAVAAGHERGCLTPEMQLASTAPNQLSSHQHRAAGWLQRHAAIVRNGAMERQLGIDLRITRSASIRLAALADNERDETLQTIAAGITDARRSLTEISGLPAVDVQVLVADLGASTSGYTTRSSIDAQPTIVINAASSDLYRAAAHQYAHGVTQSLSIDFPAAWGEAFAVWATMRSLGQDRADEYASIDARLAAMHLGLTSDDTANATGNAAWLMFLESRWDAPAVRTTLEELARGGDTAAALERGLRRVSPLRLRQAYADFQLWSLFTGERDDSRHLRGANRLAAPRFTSAASGLPALSIRRDPPLAPWGGSRIQLFNGVADRGGLQVDFEGDFSAQWDADLVLTSRSGAVHRVPLEMQDGRVETTVPLDGLAEAILLVRRVDADESTPRGYSYSVHRETGYPFELADSSIETIQDMGLLVQWETTHEDGLIGFNVLRARVDGGSRVQVNPVWIPALGANDRGVGYRFLDAQADPSARYEYTIQAITEQGLTSHSGALAGSRD